MDLGVSPHIDEAYKDLCAWVLCTGEIKNLKTQADFAVLFDRLDSIESYFITKAPISSPPIAHTSTKGVKMRLYRIYCQKPM